MRRVHAICFPEERPEDDETDAAFWDRVTSFHDQDAVEWFLLFDETKSSDPPTSSSSSAPPAPPPPSTPLLGFAAATPYADSVYGLHLAVVPEARRAGRGAWLMREVQRRAASAGVFAIQATVDVAGSARLVRYYERCGARVIATGAGSAGSAPASVVRIRREFDEAVAEAELRESRARARREEAKATKATAGRRVASFVAGTLDVLSSDYCRANVYPKLAAAAAVLLVVYVARDRARRR